MKCLDDDDIRNVLLQIVETMPAAQLRCAVMEAIDHSHLCAVDHLWARGHDDVLLRLLGYHLAIGIAARNTDGALLERTNVEPHAVAASYASPGELRGKKKGKKKLSK